MYQLPEDFILVVQQQLTKLKVQQKKVVKEQLLGMIF